VPFFQFTFETHPIRIQEMVIAIGISSIILFAVEIEKLILNNRRPLPQTAAT
jgi:hypothetical protein